MDTTQMPSSRKTICFLVDCLGFGGRENAVIDAIKCLSSDYEITLASLYGISAAFQERVSNKITIHANLLGQYYRSQDFIRLSLPLIGPRAFRRIVPGTYDFLIILHPALLLAADAKIGKKNICWSHTDKDAVWARLNKLSLMHRVRKMHLKLCYKAADATWVVTDSIRDAMRKAFGLSNIYTLENTIDCKEILSKASAYTPPNMTSECFYFVMVGRISHEKGYQKALRAFHQLKTDIPCKLIIVGDGPERDSLETYVRDNHLENQVVFTGFQSNPYPYIRCANAMIQPSLYESFGLTMLEAMVLRTHVITTSTIGGIRVTNNGKYGLIVDHTEEAVLRGLETALLPNAFTEEDCEQAYHWALSFDLPHFKRQLYQLLEM